MVWEQKVSTITVLTGQMYTNKVCCQKTQAHLVQLLAQYTHVLIFNDNNLIFNRQIQSMFHKLCCLNRAVPYLCLFNQQWYFPEKDGTVCSIGNIKVQVHSTFRASETLVLRKIKLSRVILRNKLQSIKYCCVCFNDLY